MARRRLLKRRMLHVRLTIQEANALEAQAQAAGMDVSSYVRSRIALADQAMKAAA